MLDYGAAGFDRNRMRGTDGVWTVTPGAPMPSDAAKAEAPGGYCDLYQKCQPLYDAVHKQWAMYSFVLNVGAGVLALIIGVIPFGSSIVSSGLSYGGVLALIVAATSYWGDAGNLLQARHLLHRARRALSTSARAGSGIRHHDGTLRSCRDREGGPGEMERAEAL